MKHAILLFALAALSSCSTVEKREEAPYFAKDTTGSVINSDVDYAERQALLEVHYGKRVETLLTQSVSAGGALKIAILSGAGLPLLTIQSKEGVLEVTKHVPAKLPFSPAQIVNDCLLCTATPAAIAKAVPSGWKVKDKGNSLELIGEDETLITRVQKEGENCTLENFSFGYRIRTITLKGEQ